MSYRAGSAYVPVKPDMSSFQDDVKAGLAGLDTQFAEAGDSAGKAFGSAFQDQLAASFANLPDARITADADTEGARADLDEAAGARSVPLKADASTDAARADLDEAAKSRSATINADADTGAARADLDEAAHERTATVKEDADTAEAAAKIDEAARDRTSKVKVEADKSSLSKLAADVKGALSNPFAGISPLVGLSIAGIGALGPQALGAGALGAGAAVAGGAAAVTGGLVAEVAKTAVSDAKSQASALAAAKKALDSATSANGYAVDSANKTLTSAQQAVDNAKANLAQVQQKAAASVAAAKASAEQTLISREQGISSKDPTGQAKLAQAQDAYNKTVSSAQASAVSQVAGAQKQLTDAQLRLQQANTPAALAKSQDAYNKALTDYNKALSQVSQPEQQLSKELAAVKSGWDDVVKASAPAVAGALVPWLSAAHDAMKLLAPVIQDGADALKYLGRDAEKVADSPFTKVFVDTLGKTGKLGLEGVGDALFHVADGLEHLFVDFAPDIDKVPGIIDGWAKSFDHWASSYNKSGFEAFLAKTFSPANRQALAGDLKNVEHLLGAAATDIGRLSPAAFGGLTVALDAIGKLTPDQVLALTGLFLATRTLGGIGNVAGLAKSVIGLFSGGGASKAEAEAEGGEAGAAAGSSAASAFTSAFAEEVTAALPEVFAGIGAEGDGEAAGAGTTWGASAAAAFGAALTGGDSLDLAGVFAAIGGEGTGEAAGAGTAWGGAAAAAFGVALGAGDSLDLAGVFLGIGAEGSAEAAGAGAAWGAAAATAFGVAVAAEIGGELEGALGVGLVALVAAGAAGAALGGAFGLGIKGGFSLSGAAGVVGGLKGAATAAVKDAGGWLRPAGSAAVSGFESGMTGEFPAAQRVAANLRLWVQGGTADAKTWLYDSGVAVIQGFIDGLSNPTGTLKNLWGTIENIAHGVVDFWRHALGINSPAKAMYPVGDAIPEGVGVSMLGGAHYITDAASSLADVTVQSLSGLARAQSLGALGIPALSSSPLPGTQGSGPLAIQILSDGGATGLDALFDDMLRQKVASGQLVLVKQ